MPDKSVVTDAGVGILRHCWEPGNCLISLGRLIEGAPAIPGRSVADGLVSGACRLIRLQDHIGPPDRTDF